MLLPLVREGGFWTFFRDKRRKGSKTEHKSFQHYSPLPSHSTKTWTGTPSPSRGRNPLFHIISNIIPYFIKNKNNITYAPSLGKPVPRFPREDKVAFLPFSGTKDGRDPRQYINSSNVLHPFRPTPLKREP